MEEEIASLQRYVDLVVVYIAQNGVRLVVAAGIFAIGIYFGKGIGRFVRGFCEKRNIDVTLARFFAGSVQVMLTALAAIMALSKIGIEITPLIALLGAGAFGLSLAVQGPLSNYGAGIVIILTRPFRVGDTLQVQGVAGVVDEVNLGHTHLVAEDGELITIPNRKILGEILVNSDDVRVYEGVVGIAYGEDPERGISVIKEAIERLEGLSTPEGKEPEVGIQSFGDSSINLAYRVWVPSTAFHRVQFALNLAVFKAIKAAGITIPFPQREVRLLGNGEGSPSKEALGQ
jgi:small conductance mechanosensitive channel